jgi:thymidine phosphorylase
VDIPLGPSAKIRTQAEAARLRKLFEYVGNALGIHIRVVVTDGSQPIGRGIGPVLEARDVMAVLRNEPGAPTDLREHALELAGRLLDFDPALPGGSGKATALHILKSGQALAKMEQIIAAQGPPPIPAVSGQLTQDVCAERTGTVSAIDCFRIARIARLAGAPISKGAGIDVLKKIGEPVRRGEPLYRIHAALETDLGFAVEMAKDTNGYVIA